MNLPEIYKLLELELYNYCSIKNSQEEPLRRFRDSFEIPKDSNKMSIHIELNFYGGERHLYSLSSPEKYFSIEIVSGVFINPGSSNLYYDYNMQIFKFLIEKERKEIYRIETIYPHHEMFSFRELRKYAYDLNLIKVDLVKIYNWLKCLNISLI